MIAGDDPSGGLKAIATNPSASKKTEDINARVLQLPVAQHRGMLSPSRNTYLPTLHDIGGDRKATRKLLVRTEIQIRRDAAENDEEPAGFNVQQHLDAPRLHQIKQQLKKIKI